MLFDRRRKRMVDDQLAARGISDRRVLSAMATTPRHVFVDEALRERAYDDHPLPIGHGQTISHPYTVALMTEALELQGTERVLEIGTGSGYQTAILAKLCANVFSIERIAALATRARRVLDQLSLYNAALRVGDGPSAGTPRHRSTRSSSRRERRSCRVRCCRSCAPAGASWCRSERKIPRRFCVCV